MKKINLILFLFMIVLIGGVMGETTMNFLTKGFADTLYCRISAECNLISLTVDSIIVQNLTVIDSINYANITIINYTVIGEINIEGNLNAKNGTFDNIIGNIIDLSSKIDNDSIIRNTNTSWITDNQAYWNGTDVNFSNLEADNIQTDLINSSIYEDKSLVLHLSFNGNANDSSQYGNDGTNNGALIDKDIGEFDGVNDYIQMNILNAISITKPFTVTYWINPNDVTTDQVPFHHSASPDDRFGFRIIGGEIRTGIFNGAEYVVKKSGSISINEWSFISVTFDGSSTLDLKINTISQVGTGNPNLADTLFTIGRKGGSNTLHFNGSIDEVKIFNRALQPNEILRLYNDNKNYGHFNNIQVKDLNVSNELTVQGETNLFGDTHVKDNSKICYGDADDVCFQLNETDYVGTPEVGNPFWIWDNFFYLDTANDRVGIGTNNPLKQFHINAASGAEASFTRTTAGTADLTLGQFYFGNTNIDTQLVRIRAAQDGFTNAGRLEFWVEKTGEGIKRMWVLYSDGGLAFGENFKSTNPGRNNMIIEGKLGIGTTTPNEKLTVVGNMNLTGNFSGNQIYGEMFNHTDTGNTVTITDSTTYFNITNLRSSHSNGFSVTNNALIPAVKGMYKFIWVLGFGNAGNNVEYQITLKINEEIQNECETHRKIGANGDVGATMGTCFLPLEINDEVRLGIKNIDGTQNAIIYIVQVNAVRIGD